MMGGLDKFLSKRAPAAEMALELAVFLATDGRAPYMVQGKGFKEFMVP